MVTGRSAGKAARTDFRRLARFRSADLLRAHLHTGRTHQLRAHMLAMAAAPGDLDPTFGMGGKVVTSFPGGLDTAAADGGRVHLV